MTLGSLFDGAGGFPLAGAMAGFTPLWGSEIEPFPMRVTTKRLPKMKHLGNITEMDGRSADPVDVITFGSPCQDLSIAGRREGLTGERSGLFQEAIRIIREMREATNGKYPRFIVWENVPGAFSSNKGEDFRTVLEEIAKTKDGGVSIPRPEKGKWMPAGEIVGDDYSIAWRTYDAQFWGVPQRRKRIYLVADFTGRRAGYIQFERESLCRNFTQSQRPGQGAAGASAGNSGTSSEPTWVIQGSMIGRQEKNGPQGSGINKNVCFTLNTADRHAVVYGLSAKASNAWKSDNPHSGCYEAEAARTLDTHGGNPTCAQGGNIVVQEARVYENHGQDSRIRELGDIGETVAAKYGTGGNNTPIVVEHKPTPQERSAYGIDRAAFNQGRNALYNFSIDEELEPCLVAKGPNAVAEPQDNDYYPYRARRLTPLECCRLQGYPDWWCAGLDTAEPTEQEVEEWTAIFETHRKATAPKKKPKTKSQVRKWLQKPQTDSAEYKMWGNSLAIPCAYTVLAGIAEALTDDWIRYGIGGEEISDEGAGQFKGILEVASNT